MECIFYKTLSPKNAINKVLTNSATLQVNLKEDVNILSPQIKVQISSNIFSYNYAYIPSFTRYYFVADMIIISARVCQFNLEVDVLETYKNDILASTCHFIKSSHCNMYGANIKTTNKREQEIIEIPTQFSLQDYFIATISRGSEGALSNGYSII